MKSTAVQSKRAMRCGAYRDRSGFTLVEILVVVGIVAVLLSVLGLGVMYALNTAKVAKTRGTIAKVQGLLQSRLDAALRRDPDKILVGSLMGRFPNKKQAEVIARKYEFRQNFPQTWAEIAVYYPNLLPKSGETAPMTVTPAAESAEVLLFLLTRANILGYPPEGDDAFDSSEKRDTDGNGKLELIDGWNNPLRFYRWPTRLVRNGAWAAGGFTVSATARGLLPSLPTVTADLTHDADDKYGFLRVTGNTATGLEPAEVTYFEQGGAPSMGAGSRFFGMGPFHTPETYSYPLVVSAGPDFTLGLYEPGDTTNLGYLAAPDATQTAATNDNISNLAIRSGGR